MASIIFCCQEVDFLCEEEGVCMTRVGYVMLHSSIQCSGFCRRLEKYFECVWNIGRDERWRTNRINFSVVSYGHLMLVMVDGWMKKHWVEGEAYLGSYGQHWQRLVFGWLDSPWVYIIPSLTELLPHFYWTISAKWHFLAAIEVSTVAFRYLILKIYLCVSALMLITTGLKQNSCSKCKDCACAYVRAHAHWKSFE